MSNDQEKGPEKFEREIAEAVDRWASEGKRLTPQFITHEIIQLHEDGLARQNEHVDFLRHYTFKGLRQCVGQYISKKFGESRVDRESMATKLPGFEYIQTHYIVGSGDEEEAVPVEAMTDEDIEARVNLLRKRGKACFAHADELERFKLMRKRAA
jgi:hypothetical protein